MIGGSVTWKYKGKGLKKKNFLNVLIEVWSLIRQSVIQGTIVLLIFWQVKYCSEACRTAAWEKYHRVMCMSASRCDSEHPLAKLQEAWRYVSTGVGGGEGNGTLRPLAMMILHCHASRGILVCAFWEGGGGH